MTTRHLNFKPKDDHEILAIIKAEMARADGSKQHDQVNAKRRKALEYYLGGSDVPVGEGRSSVTSTDVADAIEWIKPQVVEQLTRSHDVVHFEANYGGDEQQAELEAALCFDVFMNHNNGFLLTNQVVNDILLGGNGITKTWYEDTPKVTAERYTGLNEQELMHLLGQDGVEVAAREDRVDEEAHINQQLAYQQQVAMAMQQGMPPPPEPPPPVMIDVKLRRETPRQQVKVCAVPPEEFRISGMHNTPNPKEAPFTAHVKLCTVSELIEQGYPPEVVSQINRAVENDTKRHHRFNIQGENTHPSHLDSRDPAAEVVEISECYLYIDLDGDGITEFAKITVAGGDNNPTHVLDVEEMDPDMHPFCGGTGIIMSHKFHGLSIYDRLKEIQDQKTHLLRNQLDNITLLNNQRTLVVEGEVQLDDLLVSRPGGIVRQSAPGMVEPMPTNPLGQEAFQMMEYLDMIRASRVGVNPEGPLQGDLNEAIGSQGVERLLAAREGIVGLIVRVIAESWLKPQMLTIRHLLRRHYDAVINFSLRGEWREVLPSQWPDRARTTVHVGTGSGNEEHLLQALTMVIQGQNQIKQDPMQVMVGPQQEFNAWRRFCHVSGLKADQNYFLDPQSQQGQQAGMEKGQQAQEAQAKEEQNRVAMLEMQAKLANAEMGKAEAQAANVQMKAQLESMQLQLDGAEEAAKLQLEYAKLDSQEAIKLTELESKESIELSKLHAQNKQEVANGRHQASQ